MVYRYVSIYSIINYKGCGLMEKQEYIEKAELFKVLSDANRLQIIDMLSCGEMCGCKILEKFNITQPTLSHHMKVLIDSGLVISRKEANWIHYKLNETKIEEINEFLKCISKNKENCICKK